jgi:GPH family glycoside/pentoside/hexuronide:cation symporter
LFDNSVQGARGLAIVIGVFVILVGVVPAIFLRERMSSLAADELGEAEKVPLMKGLLENVVKFFKGFWITIRFSPFLKLCGATFLVFNGFMMVSAFSAYVMIYYVFAGDKDAGATLMGWNGTAATVGTFLVIPLVTWIAGKIGKRRTFFAAVGISIVGYGLKWFCYSPEHPYLLLLTTPFIAFGLGCLFTLMGSMVADVCDLDELKTGERREGMFGSIFWWVVKLGMALALALSGVLLNATGFDVELGGEQTERTLLLLRIFDIIIPMVTSGIAIWLVASYPINEKKALEIRTELEARRGKV